MFFSPECHDISMVQTMDGDWRVAVRERESYFGAGNNTIIALEHPDSISDILTGKKMLNIVFK